MKKGKLLLLGSVLISSLSLSGCFRKPSSNTNVVIKVPTIEVVSNLRVNLQGRREKTLFPTLSENSITNPSFEYSSSNSSIAKVSSAGVVTGVSTGTCDVSVTLKTNKDVKTSVKITVIDEEVEHYDYTLMFYMCGSDLEYNKNAKKDEDHGLLTKDIQEILSIHNIPDSVRIIIETGGATKWFMPPTSLEGASEISGKKLQRWEVNNQTNKLTFVEELSTNEMAKESSFTDFLSWGLDQYEASQMGVIISGHGGGIAGAAYDDNYLDDNGYPYTLQTFEVANAAKNALANSSKDKFTWIGYDCCLMQCADIASIYSEYFDYMVASQEEENGSGWNHDEYLPSLADDPHINPTEFLPKICDTFLKAYHRDSESEKNACRQTLSVLDLSKIDAVISSFEEIVPQLGTTSTAYKKISQAFEASYNRFGEGMYGLCDFNSLLKQLNLKYNINITAAQTAINDLVFYSKYCSHYSSALCGVNAFFPDYVGEDPKYGLQVGREDYVNKKSTKFVKWQAVCLSGNGFGW